MKYIVVIFTLSLLTSKTIAQDIVINEIMAKNSTFIRDEDGDFSDWIELYNTTNTSVNLINYSISDDINILTKWILPDVTIYPNSYLLIFASNKNRFGANELHSNFKISAEGEEIYLSNELGIIIDQSTSVSLPSNVSYGRFPDGSTNWTTIYTPTPNDMNNNSNQLSFSHKEGFYTSPFSLKINATLPDPIYYTLNGDTPSKNSILYSDSILINYSNSSPNIISEIPTTPNQSIIDFKAWEPPSGNIDKSTILRFASYNNGVQTSKIYSKTFFVDAEILEKYTIPIISLITDKENLFSPDSGIYVPGINYDIRNPVWTGNYFMRGDKWERDVHIEYFNNKGSLVFSQDAGVRIHGGITRNISQKSLRLYAREEYGEKYFNHKLFPHKYTDKYKRFILRTTMGAWDGQTIIKDIVAQNISSKLNIDYQDFQPVIVYINGEYWGIHTIRDRIDERYIEYTHNIDKDSVEFRSANYTNLIKYIESNDLKINANYAYVKTQIDIDNYIDYTIAEQFFANYDWPGFNFKIWKKKQNGKWRWVFYDLDGGFKNIDYNMFQHSILNDSSIVWPNPPSSTFLFRNLMQNNMFVNQLVNRFAEVLNNEFSIALMTYKLDSIKEIYAPEINKHIDRWNYPNSYHNWEKDIEDDLLSFIKGRSCRIRNQIVSFFNLNNFDFDCEIFYKGIDIISTPNPSNGDFLLFNNSEDILNSTITITNMNSLIVFSKSNVSLIKSKNKYFDLSHLPSGIYIIQINSINFSKRIKIIIYK